VHQKVTFKPEEELPAIFQNDKPIEIVAFDEIYNLPHIGIAASTESETLTQGCVSALRDLKLHHYRIEVTPSEENWINKFRADCKLAEMLDTPLEIALHIGDNADLENFRGLAAEVGNHIKHIILLSADKAATAQALINHAASLKAAFPSALIGAGTDFNYRELNVNPFDSDNLDFISYSVDPQEHATDSLTIIENIAGQAETVKSARELYPAVKRFHISSLTLRKRYNPAASAPADRILSNEKKADPRQLTQFAAVFTLGSIKSLASSHANSATLYQTAGTQGVMSLKGDKYPVYHILHQILPANNYRVRHTISSDPVTADALLLTNGKTAQLIMVNYTSSGQMLAFGKDKYVLGPYETKTVNSDYR
jgi:hypothetical protein